MKATSKPVSFVTKHCYWCEKPFSFRSVGPVNNAKRVLCSNPCAASWRNAQPGRTEKFNQWIGASREAAHVARRGQKFPEYAARMRANNPMHKPEALEKMRRSLQGRTFVARGGNGQTTKPQQILAEKLGLPMEHVIVTAPVKGQFPSLPHCYKVDLADPISQTAIEVDGRTHELKLWRFLDHRKTEILTALGWSVLRFTNKQVMADPDAVAHQIRTYIASR